MIKKYLETRKLKKRARILTGRLDALWNDATRRRDGKFGTVVNTDRWRDTRDFLKRDEQTNYDAWAAEHFEIAKKLGIPSPHFDIRRQGGDPLNADSPTGLMTVRHDTHDEVTFKEEDGFFVLYRNGEPDPNVEPVPVEEWNTVVVDVDETELHDSDKLLSGTQRPTKTPKYPL